MAFHPFGMRRPRSGYRRRLASANWASFFPPIRQPLGGETVWVIELLRIYEYCRDNPVGSGESRVHEAQMAIMQGTHHRDDGNFETFPTPCGNDAA